LGGGVGLLLIGVLALMRFMRKPKPVLESAAAEEGMEEHVAHETSEGEHHLLDALAQNPGDPHLSLELLNLYYAHRDATKFEAAAEAMYAHIADPTQPEWQQVRAMGEELCPHNPLFGGSDIGGGGFAHAHDEQTVFGQYDTGAHAHEESFDLDGAHAHDAKPAAAEDSFDFDLTDHAAVAAAPAHATDFAHEPPAVGRPTPPPPSAAVAKPADDFFAGEDAIGTKLDLAKAYLDMGDPEGARSMLDEVMAEGNDAQKGEARKLLAEIR
jgi:pilus assembly protein FimV